MSPLKRSSGVQPAGSGPDGQARAPGPDAPSHALSADRLDKARARLLAGTLYDDAAFDALASRGLVDRAAFLSRCAPAKQADGERDAPAAAGCPKDR